MARSRPQVLIFNGQKVTSSATGKPIMVNVPDGRISKYGNFKRDKATGNLIDPRSPDHSTLPGNLTVSTDVHIDKISIQEIVEGLSSFDRMLYSNHVVRAQHQLVAMAKAYWKNTIYKYYNTRTEMGLEVSGQLGNALIGYVHVGSINFMMGRLVAHSRGGEYDYTQAIVWGTMPSPGGYSPRHDARMNNPKFAIRGEHPGTLSNATRWDAFYTGWRDTMEQLAQIKIEGAVKDHIREYFSIENATFSNAEKYALTNQMLISHGRKRRYNRKLDRKFWTYAGDVKTSMMEEEDKPKYIQRIISQQDRQHRIDAMVEMDRQDRIAENLSVDKYDLTEEERKLAANENVINANPARFKRHNAEMNVEIERSKYTQERERRKKSMQIESGYNVYEDYFMGEYKDDPDEY